MISLSVFQWPSMFYQTFWIEPAILRSSPPPILSPGSPGQLRLRRVGRLSRPLGPLQRLLLSLGGCLARGLLRPVGRAAKRGPGRCGAIRHFVRREK